MKIELPSVKVTLAGKRFEIRALAGGDAYPVWVRLLKMVGPGIEAATGKDFDAITMAIIGRTLQSLPVSEMQFLRDTFVGTTAIEFGPEKMVELSECFDFAFAGKPKLCFLWLFECIKLNFADFLDASFLNAVSTFGARFQQQSQTNLTGSPSA